MATLPFNFLQAEEEMKKATQPTAAPSFNFLEAEKQMQATQPTTTPSFNFLEAEKEMQATAATPAPTITRGLPPVPEGTEEIPTMIPRQRAVAGQAVAAKREAEEAAKISVEDAAKLPKAFKIATDYMRASGQEPQGKDESNEDFFRRYVSQQRFTEWSQTFGGVPQLMRLMNSSDEDKKAIAEGIRLSSKLKTEKGFGPTADVLKGIAADAPAIILSGGVGKVFGKATTSALIKGATEQTLKKAGTVGLVGFESLYGGAVDLQQQKIEQQTAAALGEKVPEIDLKRLGTSVAISGLMGWGVPKVFEKADLVKMKTLEDEMAKQQPFASSSPAAPYTKAETVLADGITQQMDKVYVDYMKRYGREFLDEIDPANTITDSKVKTEYSKAAIRLAMKVINDDPNFILKPGEQISTAIGQAIKNLDKVDDVVLERALRESNITPQQFAYMFKATTSEAGRTLGYLGQVAAKLKKENPEFFDSLTDIYKIDSDSTKNLAWYKTFNGVQLRVNREWKALLTSTIGATARNTISLGIAVPYKAAVQALEGIPYVIGKTISAAREGGKPSQVFAKSMSDNIKDSFGVFYYMRQTKLAEEITDKVLASNPLVRNNLLSSLQDTGDRNISALARWANSFNVAVDSVSRRAVFTASLERQLHVLGKDLYKDYLIPDKPLPASLIKEAEKDALVATFSYLPKKNDKTLASSFEKSMSSAANTLIDAANKTVGVNYVIPFPRYMANHMAFLYRNSPLGLISVKQELGVMKELLDKAARAETKEEAERLTTQAYLLQRRVGEKVIYSAAGLAVLNAATEHREKNPDSPWYELPTRKGTLVDVRNIGPFIAPYLAVGEVIARAKQARFDPKDVKDAFESIIGTKLKAGQPDSFITSVYDALTSENAAKKFAIDLGKGVGGLVSGASQPFVVQLLSNLFDSARKEGTVVRDPRAVESEDVVGAFTEAAGQQAVSRIPMLKEDLPVLVKPLSEGEQRREGEFFNNLVGFRQTLKRAPVETEIIRLNLDPYTLYGTRTGIAAYDKAFTEAANKLVLTRVQAMMNSKAYKDKPDYLKVMEMKNAIQQATGMARTEVEESFNALDVKVINQKRYGGFPREMKVAINQLYAQENNGKTIEEDKAWDKLTKYETIVKMSAKAPTETPAQQMKLLGF